MGLLKHFRSKSRLRNSPEAASYDRSVPLPSAPRPSSRDCTARLPPNVLENIFSYVCPHTRDLSYLPSEESQIGDGCMLCDLRDLSNCARVSRKWYASAQKLLYESVRIDPVHYCELEELLAEKRRKAAKHFRSKSHVEPVDVPNIRLQLLCRTVREQPSLAAQVLFLKLPYMTRETAKGDLARTVSALPSLRYVDLPDGFYTGDPSCLALRQELQARCPDIRKMSYRPGSEEALELLAQRHWQRIEVLELNGLAIEPATLRIVLGSLPTLQELTLSNLPWLDDSVFGRSAQFPDFPGLDALKLIDTPNVTAQGLRTWVESPHVREHFYSLTLQNTGVSVQDLSVVLWASSSLHHLSITETVTKSLTMAAQELPPLTSISLRTLHFEIVSSEDVHGLQKPAESYYRYLATSLHQNALPGLQTLYVRDQGFPDLLLVSQMMPPPMGKPSSFAAGPSGTNGSIGGFSPGNSLKSKPSNLSTLSAAGMQPQATGGGFNQTLEVFSKGIDELEWVFTPIVPQSNHSQSQSRKQSTSAGRPLSAYSASRGLGPQWAQGGFGGEARKSVIVGNGFGGFLAIPQEEAPQVPGRPTTSDGTGGTRWGSFGGSASGSGSGSGSHKGSEGSVGSFLKPPPSIGAMAEGHRKRASRQDLWR